MISLNDETISLMAGCGMHFSFETRKWIDGRWVDGLWAVFSRGCSFGCHIRKLDVSQSEPLAELQDRLEQAAKEVAAYGPEDVPDAVDEEHEPELTM